jgi:hypothetical protein
MKILNKLYMQQAFAEEARGNYQQAAVLYLKAGESEKVGEMYELLGNLASALPEKIKAYQQAIRWYKLPEHREPLAAKLATVMELDIRQDGEVSPAEQHRLPDVAEYYALAKQWEKAGKIYEELGMYEQATEMYVQGGAIEQVEQIASRKGDHDHRALTAQPYYEEAFSASKIGQRDKAYQSLKQCLTLDEHHADARALLETLNRLLQACDVRRIHVPIEDSEYILFGKQVVTVGRKEDNDIVVSQAEVSRQHARIGFDNQTVMVEDLNSSNGTRLNGLKIQKTATVHDRDVIGIGTKMRFEVCLQRHPAGVSAILRPLDQEGVQKRYIVFSGELLIGSENECGVFVQHLAPASVPYLFKIKYQQPFWYLYIHPYAADVEWNGTPVSNYVVVAAGDKLTCSSVTFLFE